MKLFIECGSKRYPEVAR